MSRIWSGSASGFIVLRRWVAHSFHYTWMCLACRSSLWFSLSDTVGCLEVELHGVAARRHALFILRSSRSRLHSWWRCAAGPICFEPDGKCCWDRVVALGWDVIVQERQMRLNTKSEYHYSSAIYKVRPPLGARDSLSDLFGWPTFDYQSLHWKLGSCKHRAATANFTLHCICEYIYERCVCVFFASHISNFVHKYT